MIRRRAAALPLSRATLAAFAAALVIVSTAAFSFGRRLAAPDDIGFPHATHAHLFPTCSGCHAGITAGDTATMFPPASACAECHNSRDVRPVAWTSRAPHPTNLRFDHVRHARLSDSTGTALRCESCHGLSGASSGWMQVARARPETCIACHAHSAPSHLDPSSPCMTCHVPVTRAAALSDSAIASFPKPPSHDAPEFLETHGVTATRSIASCATCHSRESCARCHLNAATLQPIAQLGSDRRIARLVAGKPGVYTVPASHTAVGFLTMHGALARTNVQTCATCHAQPSCRACHTGSLGAKAIDALPGGGPSQAGVQLERPRAAPPPPAWPGAVASVGTASPKLVYVHPADFARTHGPVASSGRLNCAGCHQERLCVSCHQGNGQRLYHPFNFVARHPSEAYARETNCASCHNTEVFCRSCHRDVAGIAADSKRRSGAAHAGQPLWLLQHGEAARRGMQSCASCHQQTDCLQCHSTVSGRVNPHGPDFNAAQMEKKNPSLCAYCHVGKPR